MCAYTYIPHFPGSYCINFFTSLYFSARQSNFFPPHSPKAACAKITRCLSPIGNSNLSFISFLQQFWRCWSLLLLEYSIQEVPKTKTPGIPPFFLTAALSLAFIFLLVIEFLRDESLDTLIFSTYFSIVTDVKHIQSFNFTESTNGLQKFCQKPDL